MQSNEADFDNKVLIKYSMRQIKSILFTLEKVCQLPTELTCDELHLGIHMREITAFRKLRKILDIRTKFVKVRPFCLHFSHKTTNHKDILEISLLLEILGKVY